MSLTAGTCDPWPVDETCMKLPAGTDPATITKWSQVATDYLFMMTGRRIGPSCPSTVRPCRKQCWDAWAPLFGIWPAGYNGSPWIPYVDTSGQMRNASLCGCGPRGCHCGGELCEIELSGPVYDVIEVKVDGVVLDPSTYNILDGRFLVRRTDDVDDDGNGLCWPTCQDMSLPDTEEGTFSVTYRTGLEVPQLAVQAVSALTAHFIRGCDGCGCGAGTQQNLARLQRQGVELDFADPTVLFTDGRTGIDIVDFAIKALNPGALPRAMRVLSPDSPRRPRLWG
jgi:hypothetical protein